MAFGDEVGQHHLRHDRGMAVDHRLGLDDGFDQRQRRHQIAEPQAGKQHFRQRADIEYATGGVQALQRRQRRAGVAVFAVVIVLDHPRLVGCGPSQQFQPPLQAHRHAQRQLVRWRDDDQFCIRAMTRAVGDAEAIGIDRHRRNPSLARMQRRAGAAVAGILDPGRIVRPQQQRRQQEQRLLRAGRDDDLLRRAIDAARRTQVDAQQLA